MREKRKQTRGRKEGSTYISARPCPLLTATDYQRVSKTGHACQLKPHSPLSSSISPRWWLVSGAPGQPPLRTFPSPHAHDKRGILDESPPAVEGRLRARYTGFEQVAWGPANPGDRLESGLAGSLPRSTATPTRPSSTTASIVRCLGRRHPQPSTSPTGIREHAPRLGVLFWLPPRWSFATRRRHSLLPGLTNVQLAPNVRTYRFR